MKGPSFYFQKIMKIDIFFSAPKKAVRLDVYFHFLFM